MSVLKLNASLREGSGKGVSRKLRRDGQVPAVLVRKGSENKNLQVLEREFLKVFEEAGNTALIEMQVGSESFTVLVKEVQKHPYRNEFLHVDFQEVTMGQVLRVNVPVVLLNRESIKVQPSVLSHNLDTVEIEVLPRHIPQEFVYNVEDMKIGDVVYVKDLKELEDSKYTLITDGEEVICTLSEPQEEVLVESTEEAEVPEIGKE